MIVGSAAVAVTGSLFAPAPAPAQARALPSECSQTGVRVTCVYKFTGSMQIFTVPRQVSTYDLDLIGAQGGEECNRYGDLGGYGAELKTRIRLSAQDTPVLRVYVGGRGHNSIFSRDGCSIAEGGYHGGARGGQFRFYGGGGGGGASEIRFDHGMIAIAGGGGGAGSTGASISAYNGRGGNGGATGGDGGPAGKAFDGAPGGSGGKGATPFGPGAGGSGGIPPTDNFVCRGKDGLDGTALRGGVGAGHNCGGDGGGGGGGLFGGGGGGQGSIGRGARGEPRGSEAGGGGGGGGGSSGARGPATITSGAATPDGFGLVTISYNVSGGA